MPVRRSSTRPSSAPAGGRKRPGAESVGAHMDQIVESARKSMNTCPICKMPLFINDGFECDRLWRNTQFWFKGKPSFCLDEAGARNKNVFGPVDGIGFRNADANANACHFLHVSASRGLTYFNGIWDMFTDPEDRVSTVRLKQFKYERPVKSITFTQKLNITYSVFSKLEAMATDNVVDKFIWREGRYSIPLINRAVDIVAKGTFTGCWDCNHKMTQMELIPTLFECSFPRDNDLHSDIVYTDDVTPKERGDILLNAKIHYLLLQAMLRQDNAIRPRTAEVYMDGNNQVLHVLPEQQHKWKFKLVILWCLLMMMLSNWNINALPPLASHHAIYIFSGTSDLYLSLILYMIYIANFKGTGHPLSFEEFHYFYSTNFVFHLKRIGHLVDTPAANTISNSLTAAIMRDGSCSGAVWASLSPGLNMFKNTADFMNTATNHITTLYNGVVRFSDAYLKPLCLHLYDPARLSETYANYFSSLRNVYRIDDYFSQINTNSIQVFVDYLTHVMYWYHFKNITMPQISHAFFLARGIHGAEAREVMDRWYKHASNAVSQLHGPMPTSEDRALVRLSAQFAAALRLRASSGASSSCRS